MTIEQKLIALVRGLKDVTPGPWISEEIVSGKSPDAGCGVIASDDDLKISNPSRGIVAFISRLVGRTNIETMATSRHIARCDPQSLREIAELAMIGLEAKREMNLALFADKFGDTESVCRAYQDSLISAAQRRMKEAEGK